MPFDFRFGPMFGSPWPVSAVFPEGAVDRITSINPSTGCFSMNNEAWYAQTPFGTMGVRIRTPALIPPFNSINIQTDSNAEGTVAAAALLGYARARVEARLRVFDNTGTRVLVEAGPEFFGGSSIDIPVFWGLGFQFSGTAFTDAVITANVGTAPLIVEVRISSWAVAAGNAWARADIFNACVTGIRVFCA